MPDHYRFNYSIQILFYCCLDIQYHIHIIRYIMSRHQRLNFIVDYNPIALAFNKLFQHSSFLQSTSNYFSSLFLSKIEKQLEIPKVLFTIGVVALSYKVFSTIYKEINRWKWVSDHFKNRKQLSQNNLKNRYGDCYVVVTGCTEGIGLSFALELARLGFGLVLVARNKEKLERRIVQIKALCPNLRYQKVIGDLSKIDEIKRVSQQLAQLSKRIDIGMVVNNAGLAGQGFTNLINKDVKLLKDIISTNFTSVYHINAALVPSLRLRKHQSAILNVSSCCGTFISHGNGTYTFSKVLLDIYSRAMTLQNKDKIDVLTIRPFGVKTPMMSMRKSKFMITPKDCVLSSLADLGKSETTWTGFLHKVQASYFVDVSEQQRLQMYDKLFQFAKK